MLYLEASDPGKDIRLYINSPGGSVTAGFAIYDTMQYVKCDVSTICLGLAASFGAFLLAGGAKGKRIALPNAEIMIHQPAIHGNGINGQVTDIKIVSDQLQKNKQRLNHILAENTDLRKTVSDSVSCELEEKLRAKLPSYYVGDSFVRIIPFKNYINIEAKAVIRHKEELAGYKITPKGMVQIY